MDHPQIDEQDVLERYLQGRLDRDDELAFEAHLLECEECFEQTRWADELGQGLRAAAAQDVVRAAASAGMLAWITSRGRRWGGALAIALMLISSGLYLRENARLREVMAPQINTPVFTLGSVRGSTVSQVSLRESPEWIVLTMALPTVEHPSYRADLVDAAGKTVWRGDGLVPDAADRLVLSVYSTLLAPGEYELRVSGSEPDAEPKTFRFEVTR
ncbi:MAG: zf-HC2 domain-containing protein [Acidobacteriota bacterium]